MEGKYPKYVKNIGCRSKKIQYRKKKSKSSRYKMAKMVNGQQKYNIIIIILYINVLKMLKNTKIDLENECFTLNGSFCTFILNGRQNYIQSML